MTGAADRYQWPAGGVSKGSRNAELTRYAGALRAEGFDHGLLLIALRAVNKGHVHPPLADRELRTIAGSVARYEQGAPPIILKIDRRHLN